jgi:hypothetical protein
MAVPFHRDILDFLAILHRRRVRYLVVGGEAVIKYGYARLTADTDVFFDLEERNVARLFSALQEFWGGDIAGVDSAAALRQKGSIFQFGAPPNRLDLLNSIDGVSFASAWKGRATERFPHARDSIPVHFIGLNELIRNKKRAARHKDLDDLRFLLEARRRRSASRPGR